MVFAVDDQQSFLNIRTWLQNIEDVSSIDEFSSLLLLALALFGQYTTPLHDNITVAKVKKSIYIWFIE